MSSVKGSGSRLFAGDRKSIVRILTIALFSIAMIAAALIVYQQFQLTKQSPMLSLLSEDEAVHIAKREAKWDELMMDNYRIESTLVHVKENGYAFIVDEKTLQDALEIADKMRPDKYYNNYIWKVKLVSEEQNRNEGYERESWIDAQTGKVVLSAINGSVISE